MALVALMVSPCATAFAGSISKQARRAAQVKAAVHELGTGRYARVLVTLPDHRKMEGYVAGSGEHSFYLGNLCTGDVTPVSYGQVKSLWGEDASTGMKISAGVGVFSKMRGAPDLPPCLARRGVIVPAWRRRGQDKVSKIRRIERIAAMGMSIALMARVLAY